MHKNRTNSIIIKMLVVDILSTAICLLFLSSIFTLLFLKTDINIDFIKYSNFLIIALSAIITSFLVVNITKSNGILLGVLSQVPILIFMIVEFACNHNTPGSFLIKIIISLLFGAIGGIIAANKKKKIRVK